MTNLRPCPYCGGDTAICKEIYVLDGSISKTSYGVWCKKYCLGYQGETILLCDTEQEAIDAWNGENK